LAGTFPDEAGGPIHPSRELSTGRSDLPLDPSSSEAEREALRDRNFPQFDRGLPSRAAAVRGWADFDSFHTRVAAVLGDQTHRVIQNHPPIERPPFFYRGPPGPQGLIIGEGGPIVDPDRRRRATAIVSIPAISGLIPLGLGVVI
jgi:hypothetical protein